MARRKITRRPYPVAPITEQESNAITCVMEIIKPEDAKRILDEMPAQRSLNRDTVILYAESMKNNEWLLNGETIIFDEEGKLMDGQHRLSACVESGVPLHTMVMRGVPRRFMPTLDIGRTRSLKDQAMTTPDFKGRLRDPKKACGNVYATLALIIGLKRFKFIEYQSFVSESMLAEVEHVVSSIGTLTYTNATTQGAATFYPFYQFRIANRGLKKELDGVMFILKNGPDECRTKDIPEISFKGAKAVLWFLTSISRNVGGGGKVRPYISLVVSCLLRSVLLNKRTVKKMADIDSWKTWAEKCDIEDGIEPVSS